MGKPDLAKMEGDIRAHANALADLQWQIDLIKQRLAKVEVVKAGPQDRELYRGEPDPQEPQPPETG